jgi:hypothetical protein
MNAFKLTSRRALLLSAAPILGIVFPAGPRVSDDTTIEARLALPDNLLELRDQIDLAEDSVGKVKEVARKKSPSIQRIRLNQEERNAPL